LGDQRNDGESNFNSGDGTDQMAQPWMFMMMMMMMIIKAKQCALLLNFILAKNSTCFGQAYNPSSKVFILYSQQQVFVILVRLTVC
jgi:hypothetical protein